MDANLPINDVLGAVIAAMDGPGVAVLQAPPGAGKTTLVPLALLEAGQKMGGKSDAPHGKIIMLEPRRLAARAAAERMAHLLGEKVGQTVGFRIRGEASVSRATKIEVVTEGILTAMLQGDPSLEGIGTVIFDEFHERSLNADLGLALTLEARAALREDLRVLVMSATLDGAPVAAMLGGAPLITSDGRMHPVETIWLDRPLPAKGRFEAQVADLTRTALAQTDGGVLVFLPGAGEIGRVSAILAPELPPNTVLHSLYGAADPKAQRAALAVEAPRKLVLATSIAETSLTIPGIRVVVDAGRARRARFDAGRGMSRLVTERASKAEADQRRGRAGREAPGICYRMWARAEEGAMPAFAPAEIETADLTGLALSLATWGSDPADMAFLTPPGAGAFAEARALLTRLGALDGSGRITDHGRVLSRLPLHPRLAHMLVRAGPQGVGLAALLNDADPLRRADRGIDLTARLQALAGQNTGGADHGVLSRLKGEVKRLRKLIPDGARPKLSVGEMAALAFPDRIGQRRKGDAPRWQFSGGGGGIVAPGDGLASAPYLVAVDLDGDRRDAKIRLAAEISQSELRALFDQDIHWQNVVHWSKRDAKVIAEHQEKLFDLVLHRDPLPDPPPEAVASALSDGLAARGLSVLAFSKATTRLRTRVQFARATLSGLPDLSDEGLMNTRAVWFEPYTKGAKRLEALTTQNWKSIFLDMIEWKDRAALEKAAPDAFQTPLGRNTVVEWDADGPRISVRLQEMFGLATHPRAAGRPITIELLSPAGRPLQVTQDLPGFWASSYGDVRRDMRGRYPKHPWPEDPANAVPTTRAKPRR